MIEVVSTRRRNRKSRTTAKIAPSRPSVRMPASPEVISSAWSSQTNRLMPASDGSAGDLGLDPLGDRGGDFHGVRLGALVNGERDGGLVVQAPPERDRRLPVGHVGDVGDREALVVHRQAADLFDRGQGPEPAHRGHLAVRPDASERHVAVHVGDAVHDLAEVEAVGGEPVEAQVDPHLARLHPVEVHPGDPRDAADGVGDPPLQAVVVRREVHAGGGDPRLHDRDLGGREGVDVDLPHVARQVRARVLDSLEHLRAGHVHRLAPRELELEVGAVGGGGGADPAGAGDGGERLLERLHDLALDLPGAGVRVGDGHEHPGEVHVRQEGEGDPAERDASQHQQAQQHHRGGDGPVHGEFGKTHAVGAPVGAPVFRPAPPSEARRNARRPEVLTAQTSSGRTPSTPSGSPPASAASRPAVRR